MSRWLRVLLALGVVVLGLAALLLLLTLGDAAFSIDARLESYPTWVRWAWWGGIGLLGLGVAILAWRLLLPPRSKRTPVAETATSPPVSAEDVEQALSAAREAGVDTAAVDRELAELRRRSAAGEIHVAVFGEISTGKSALVRALLPDVDATSDVRGGTTREISRFRWKSHGGDSLILSDMPGTEEANGELDELASDEAQRAHIVVYVADGDLNRRQHTALSQLLALGKPLVLVLNKTDRYAEDDAERLADRLRQFVDGKPNALFVKTSAAGQRTVFIQQPDGQETRETRAVDPDVGDLTRALQTLIDGQPEILEDLRDSAAFVLARKKLDQALAQKRRENAEKLVDRFAMKAVVGAMAAVTPGSDLVIQGWLGTQMVKQLTSLYDTKASKLDTELLLKLVQQHVGRAHTLILAVAGNGLKAFPGVGTLAGGAMHAVAYGMIFRTLGRALADSLSTRGEFHPRQTAKQFEETLGEDLESSARNLARVVIEQTRRSKGDS